MIEQLDAHVEAYYADLDLQYHADLEHKLWGCIYGTDDSGMTYRGPLYLGPISEDDDDTNVPI